MPKKKEVVKMTKVKSDTVPPSLKLDFTGKMSILIDLAEYGPMEYRVDDKELCFKIIRLLVDEMGPTTTVNSYNKRTENTFRKILDF